MKELPSIDCLRSALSFDPETGELHWKYRDDMPGNWNTRYAGQLALNADKGQGYRSGTVNGKRLVAHRVAWALYNGEWPNGEIDHINGVANDNRIANLRIASRSGNCSNIKGRRPGVRCFKGVSWYKRNQRFVAKIASNGKVRHIGYFDDEIAAAQAYDKAANQLFGEYARTNADMGLYEAADRISVREAARKRVKV